MDASSLSICINRFLEELGTINSYVEYMEDNFYLKYIKLDLTSELLSEYEFDIKDSEQRKVNQQILKNVQAVIENKIEEYEEELNSLEKIRLTSRLIDNPMLKDKGFDFVEYFSPVYQDDYKKYINKLTAIELKDEIEQITKMKICDYSLKKYEDLIEYMKIKYHNSCIDEIGYDYEELLNYQTLYRIFDFENPVNIYRQSFILMITAFDATMYDVAKILFRDDFFNFISKIDKKGKISFEEISISGSFNALQEKIITEYLDSTFIHKLLFTLKSFNKDLFDVNGHDYIIDLIEMIKRRNIHVHNKGIVDQKYFESSNNHNKYNFTLGQYASISDSYYMECHDLLNSFMLNIDLLDI